MCISQKFSRIAGLLIMLLALSGCTYTRKDDVVEGSGFYFDTYITFTIYGTKEESLLDELYQLCERYERMFSKTIGSSEISQISDQAGNWVTISEETQRLLLTSLSACEKTRGAFDITIAPVVSLWDFGGASQGLPQPDAVAAALQHTNYENVLLKDGMATLSEADMSIDLGAIAKGFIADELKDFLTVRGIESAIINLGGDVQTIGSKPDGNSWNVGIQEPFGEQGETIAVLPIENRALVTSGTYERYFEIDGEIYHHIIDPADGYPVNNGLASVTVIADSAANADAYSTACFVMGLKEGMDFIESCKDTEALFITDDLQLIYSSGLN